MTFRTFEEIDAEATPGLFTRNVAQRSLFDPLAGLSAEERRTRAEEERAKGEELASRSVVAAAFRQDNTIASFLSRKDTGVDNFDDGKFDPVRYVEDHRLQGYEDAFVGVLNSRRADAIRSQIEMEKRDKETLQAAGWWGVLAQIGAGVFDAPTLIPGTVAVRGATGSYAVGKSVLMAGVAAGATQAGTEAFLHASQQTRTLEESVVNVTGAVVLGSLLGGSVAGLLNKAEARGATKALDEIADIQSGKKPNAFAPSRLDAAPGDAGAAVNPHAFYVDPIDAPRSVQELDLSGAAASAVADKTAFLNPTLRGTQRYGSAARQITATVFEDTMYRTLNDAGETLGTSVEASMRMKVTALNNAAITEAELAYKASGGFLGRMRRTEFYEEVGRAMRRGDVGPNEFVTRAAKAYRKAIDEATNDILRVGLLDVDDLEVTTAASYLSRYFNHDALLMSEPQFLDVIGRHLSQKMEAAHKVDSAKLTSVETKYRQRLDDIGLSGHARADRIDMLKAQGEKLDKSYAHVENEVDELTALRGRLKNPKLTDAEKARLRGDIADVLKRGGADLETYLTQRAELRARMQNLKARNPDAKAARREQLLERIDTVQEQAERSLMAFTRRAKNLINDIDATPAGVAKADELVLKAQQQIAETRELVARAEARANKIGAAYVDAMDPAQAFDAAAMAKARQGATGDEAIAAGTKAADDMTRRIESSKATIALLEKRTARLAELADRLGRRELAKDAAIELRRELEDTLKQVVDLQSKRTLARGEHVQRVKDRAAKLTPEQIKADNANMVAHYTKVMDDADMRFTNRWGPRTAQQLADDYPFQTAGREAAAEVYTKLVGRAQQLDDVPPFVTKITAGPLKDRVFNVPDELLVANGWLVDDVREVTNRFLRSVYGEVELTRRFGRADMREQLAQVAKEYSEIKQAAGKATTIDELNGVLGREKFGKRADLQKALAEAQRILSLDERSAIEDIKAGRDLLRGTYKAEQRNSNAGSLARSLHHFNYIRQMGGVLLSNITDFYRPAVVHGIAPYMRALPDALARGLGAGSKGMKLSIREAKLAGLITERATHSILQAAGDIGDPFVSRMTGIERVMAKASNVASRWNLVNMFTDAQQTIASTVSQHRILEAVVNGARGGDFVKDGERLLRMLGMDAATQADVARYFATHGETVDGLRIANTERWLAAARATGDTREILRAENAVRVYRTILNTDVNSIVSRRGLGDMPLMAHTPIGSLLFQFSGYALGAHSRVMIRGLQESHARLIGGLVMMSSLGAMTAYLASFRSGREQHEKRMKEWAANPMKLIGEGLDRSGFFATMFDVSNRIERGVGGAIGYDYRFNPIKSPIAAIGTALGARGDTRITSTRASDSSAAFGAVLGPTASVIDAGFAALRVAGDRAAGKTPPKQDVQQSFAVVPFHSYYGVREMLQVLHGNSNFVRNQ